LQTNGHKWAIYVNPVGIDATVKDHGTLCTAAGYIWNPYYTQLADPLNVKLIYLITVINIYIFYNKNVNYMIKF